MESRGAAAENDMPSLMRLQFTDVIALGSALRAAGANASGLQRARCLRRARR